MEEQDDNLPTFVDGARPDAAHDDRLDPGTDVGGYVIDRELGRGGMGIVYAATHPLIGKRAAIKVIKHSLSNNPTTVERFVQEARAVNAIGHPNIVDIFAFDALPDGRRYLVMDLLEGESLRARLKRGALHVREAAHVIDEIASALIAAHDKGFVHRDLKPDNVFLVAHPGRTDVKLLDFGLAKLMPSAGARAFRTATGTQLGTPDYMSPEQLRGADEVDERTDVYALGVMAYEILTGRRPRRFSDGNFDFASSPGGELVKAGIKQEIADLVDSMLSREPELRPTLPAVRAVIKRVRNALPSISVVGLRMPEPEPLHSFTESKLGADPVLPTPPTGSPIVQPPTVAPQLAGLAPNWAQHPRTTVGVPPPPKSTRPLPVPSAQPRTSESRTWIIVGIVLCIAAAAALVFAIAT